MIYSNNVKNYDELVKTAPAMSLQAQGWLAKPSAPILALNGEKDPWIGIQDVFILLETGDAKMARVYPDGRHMGGDSQTGKLVMNFLRSHLCA